MYAVDERLKSMHARCITVMIETTTIRIRKTTLEKLHRICGSLALTECLDRIVTFVELLLSRDDTTAELIRKLLR